MDHTMAISVASALVSSRLDYANSVLFGCPQKHAAHLQRVQQALARVVMQSSVSPLTSTELLKQLHWLPIEWRIRFKLACLVHKIINTMVTRHTLPSSYNITSPQGPRVHLPVTYFLFRDTFHLVLALSASLRPKYGTPLSIPLHIRQSQTYSSFRRHLKTHYFISANLAP